MSNSLPHRSELVVVGASAGGVTAVRRLLAALGPSFVAPVAVVIRVFKATLSATPVTLASVCSPRMNSSRSAETSASSRP